MKKLIVEEWLSLDGFAEDKKGTLEFFPSTEANKSADKDQLDFLETIDTMLLGRKTYRLFADYWPTPKSEKEIIAPKLNGLSKMVFSKTLAEAPWGNEGRAEINAGDVVAEVRELKKGNGKDMVLWGSLSLAQALIQAHLVDEFHIQICPTLVGGGRPLFPDLDGYAKMKLIDFKRYDTGVMRMRYRPEP